MLKADLHLHVPPDPSHNFPYTAQQLIDHAASQNFQVLAFTSHDRVNYTQKLAQYAQSKNILLIPGVEKTFQGRHVLIYNITQIQADQLNTFQDLAQLKKEHPLLIIAAHPFHHTAVCLKNRILEHLDLFDAWEYSYFYNRLHNPNQKTVSLAKQFNKPLVGNSDLHQLSTLGYTYTFINAEKNIPAIFQAIKNNQVKIKTRPLSLYLSSLLTAKLFFSYLKRKL